MSTIRFYSSLVVIPIKQARNKLSINIAAGILELSTYTRNDTVDIPLISQPWMGFANKMTVLRVEHESFKNFLSRHVLEKKVIEAPKKSIFGNF